MVRRQLPEGYDIDTHFAPTYNPWDQRICLVPDGDLFRAIRKGTVAVVTDRIETFTERGVRLASGAELEADIVVTATGLNLRVLGDIAISIDGSPTKPSDTIGYKGVLLSGVPNLAVTLGYTNASWTLKCDLVATYVCRLLNYMDAHEYRVATPRAPDPSVPTQPFIDLQSGYVLRSQHLLPRQGTRRPWRLHQNYPRDVLLLRRGPVDDEMAFARS
jgi:cation diffusion facilitator CzcD-associated flavoprotein CzcO